jgi:hypothetical protein
MMNEIRGLFTGNGTSDESEAMTIIPLSNTPAIIVQWENQVKHPVWSSDAANIFLDQMAENMLECDVCKVLSDLSQPVHKSRLCSGRFVESGIAEALRISVREKHVPSIELIKTKSTQEGKKIIPRLFLEVAQQAFNTGFYDVIMQFGWQWLYSLSNYEHLSESVKKSYVIYAFRVIEEMYIPIAGAEKNNMLHNISNIEEVLRALLPSRDQNGERWRDLIPFIDTLDVLGLVGCANRGRRVRQFLVQRYGVLWRPQFELVQLQMDKIVGAAEYVLFEKLGMYSTREKIWLRTVTNNSALRLRITAIVEELTVDIMRREISAVQRIYLRQSLSRALPNMKGAKLSFVASCRLSMSAYFPCNGVSGCCPKNPFRGGKYKHLLSDEPREYEF